MWQVTANGTQGSTYIYEIDLPDYAPEGSVFEAACKVHAQYRRDRNVSEYLDIRSGQRAVRLLYPQGQREKLDKIIALATDAGLTLMAEDIDWHDGEAKVQGLDPEQWVSGMTAD